MNGHEFPQQPAAVFRFHRGSDVPDLTYTTQGKRDEQGRLIYEWDGDA